MTKNNESLDIIIALLKGIQGLPPLVAIQGSLTNEWNLAINYLKKETGKDWEELSMKNYETIELSIAYKQYFILNEEARKQELSLDELISNILKSALGDKNFLNSLKIV